MSPTAFEVKHQFWIGLAIYALAFACWPLDRRDVAGFLTKLLPTTSVGVGLGYLIAALVVAIGAALITWSFSQRVSDTPAVASFYCWIGFGLLLNLLGLAIVAVGVGACTWRVSQRPIRIESDVKDVKPDWKRGILKSMHVWIAALALVALALTLRESVFFAVLAAALATKVITTWILRSPVTAG